MTSVTRPSAEVALPRRFGIPALTSFVRGRAEDAAWVRPAFVGVTLLAALLYVVNLTVSGFANTYYSAAALAASQSWSAWFFGSFDAANFITVDKPPLATMLMGLSVRVFGLSSWSILLPEALAGVAAVALLFVIVRRSHGPVAAVIASLVMALTPAAVLIFRYNNPDALLTLLLVGAAGAFLRSLEHGRVRWVVLSAILVGLAFNTKLLQAYLVLPAFAITYLIAAPGTIGRRLGTLAIALVAVLVSSLWWVIPVELMPASAHPFIGGSTNNSALDLIFGYNGLARIFGNTFGGGGAGPGGFGGPGGFAGPGGGPGFSGTPGLLRLFNSELGGQVAWLFPFSLVGLAAGLGLRWRAPRTDARRAAVLMWGGWLLVTAATFSFMSGIIHSYYTVALAPAIGALVGIGIVELWSWRRRSILGGLVLGATILGSGILAWQLLERTPSFAPGLGLIILGVSAVVALIVALPHDEHQRWTQAAAVALGMAILLAGSGDLRHRYHADRVLERRSGRGSHRRRVRRRCRRARCGLDRLRAGELPARQPGRRQLDRGHHIGAGGRVPGAGRRAAGHGHGRLQRRRPCADPRRVQAARGAGKDPLCAGQWSRRLRRPRPRLEQRHSHRPVGGLCGQRGRLRRQRHPL